MFVFSTLKINKVIRPSVLFGLILCALFSPAGANAATGDVQFSVASQYQFGTAGSYLNNGNTIAKLFDSNFNTWWDSPNANGDFGGIDLTAAAKVTHVRVAPRPGYTLRLYGMKVQASRTGTSTSDTWTTVATIPNFPPYNPQKQYADIPVDTAGQFYRFYRVQAASNSYYGSIGEVRFIGVASSTTPYIPVAPTMSPFGGHFAQPTKVRLTSSTTDSVLYYTTDGSTPTFSGGAPQGTTQLYSGPFLITSTGTTTVKAIAVSSGTYVSDISDPGLFYINQNFMPGYDWYDTSAHLIESHNGGIIYTNNKYYWYGENFNTSSNANEVETIGITAYSSNDLLNWKNEGTVFSQGGSYILRKPHVIYNATTSQYVMWARNTTNGKVVVATSSSPTGVFSAVTTTLDPDGYGTTDVYLYKETDGTAYVVYTSNDATKIIISRLSSNYLTTTGSPVITLNNTNRNSPVLFKRGSVYYLMTTGQSGFTATTNKYSTSTSLTSNAWSALVNPFQTSAMEDNSVGYHSLVTDVIPVQGRTDGYVFMGDRFDGSSVSTGSLYNSRHVWLPITFPSANTMSISWSSGWALDDYFTSANPPSSVSSFTSSKNGLQIDLAWTNNETRSYSMYLDRATDNTFTQNLTSELLDSSAVTYTDTNIVNGNTYFYRIRVVNAAGTTNSLTVIGDFSLSSDVTAPTATITTPSAGTLVRGASVTVTATSSDNIQVSDVKIYVDDIQIGSAGTTSPYSVVWNSTLTSDGAHLLTAVATDAAGNSGTSTSVSVTVNNSSPSIAVSTSTVMQGSVNNTINITGSVTTWTAGNPGTPTFSLSGGTDANIVSQTVSGTSSASIILNAGTIAGDLLLTDPSTDATTTITVVADNILPQATVTVPSSGATLAGHTVTLTATSTDNVRVTNVQFALDGSAIGSAGTTSPYSITWDSASVLDGSHTLTATVTDGAGNIATSTGVTVTVNNSVTPTVISGPATSIGIFGATFVGTTTVSGGANSTERGFQYGIVGYTATSSFAGSFGVGGFSSVVTGLSCDTDYHYRAYSTNLSGTGFGADQVFHTQTCPTVSASGDIQFSQVPAYQFGSVGSYLNSGNTYAKVFDNDVTTWWDSPLASGAYAGLDLKAPAEITHMRIAPRKGYTVRVFGITLQGSNVGTSTSNWTTIYSTPVFPPFTPPYYPQGYMSDIPINMGGQTFRYYRVVAATSTNANIAEIKLLGRSATSTPYLPVAPTISPTGGSFTSPMRVTMSSLTTDATMYYTTDGSVPAISGGVPQGTTQQYTGMFTVGASSTVRAIAVSAGTYVSDVSEPAIFSFNRNIKPAQDLLDIKGRKVESHDGSIIYADGKYYWYGQIFNANDPEIEQVGVSVYSSNDLINWTDEGAVVYTGRQLLIERPHVLYNDTTHKYVLWGHMVNYPNSRAVIAYSDTPSGAFTVATTTYNTDGMGLNDMNLFKDTDGTGYLLYSNAANSQFVISRLSPDYLSTSGTYITPSQFVLREAPSMFIHNGIYYLMTSGLTGWAPNTNKYSTSTSPMGTWSVPVNPFQPSASEDYQLAYSSQTTHTLQIPGRDGSYIYMGDRFDSSNINGGSLYNSKHVWLPMSFAPNGTMSISWQPNWDLDTVFPTTAGPSAANNLSVTRSGNQVSLSWNNNQTPGYDLYVDRATNSGFTDNVVSDLVTSTTTSYVDTYNISSGTDYYYRIRTVNGAGTSNSTVVSTAPVVSATLSANISTIFQNSTGNSIALTGISTSWVSGTPGTPVFVVSGGSGATTTSQTIVDSTHATITLSAGTATGTLMITDPLSGATTTISVVAPVIPSASLAPTISSNSDSGVSSSDSITNITTPTFQGVASSSALVYLYKSGTVLLGTTTASSSGAWTFTPSTGFTADGPYDISVIQSVDGYSSATSSVLTIVIDTVAPAMSLFSNATSTVSGSFTLTGTSTENITGLSSSSLQLTNATAESFNLSSSSFQVTINPVASGTVSVSISPGSFSDVAGNTNVNTSTYSVFAALASSSTPATTTVEYLNHITGLTVTSFDTSARFNWNTSDATSSSQVSYGLSNSFDVSTSEIDTTPRVFNHEVLVTGLVPCATYQYIVSSIDSQSYATSSQSSRFTTTGCTGNSIVSTSTSSIVSSTSGGESSLGGLTITVPSAFSTTTSAVFQIKQLDWSSVQSVAGIPAGEVKVGTSVMNLKALSDTDSILTNFSRPISVTLTYSPSDLSGIDENTLWIYRYDGTAWYALSDCTVNTTEHTVSCTTTSFSDFTLFGKAVTVASTSQTTGGASAGGSYVAMVQTPSNTMQLVPKVTEPKVSTNNICSPYLSSYIRYGSKNNIKDVKSLQLFLNKYEKEKLSADGLFKKVDVAAVKRFQQKHADILLRPQGLKKPTGYVFAATIKEINKEVCENEPAKNISTATSSVSFLSLENVSNTSKYETLPNITLSYKMEGESVLTVQKYLYTAGYLKVKPNGYFGLKTKEALFKFQKDNHIAKPNGVFGPATRKAMMLNRK